MTLALLLTALGQIEAWTVPDPGGPRAMIAAAALAMTVPLGWRRQWPLRAVSVTMAALAISTFAWEIPDKTLFPTIAIVVSVYSVAAYCDLRGALVGVGIVTTPVFAHQVVVQGGYADAVFIAVMVSCVWAAGRGVRAHGERASVLETHAATVEREAEQQKLAALAEERLRIARELHDVVAHSVSVMTVQAAAERRVLDDSDATRDVLVAIEETGRQAMTEMRRLLGMLRAGDTSLALAPQPGMEHIDVLLESVRAAGLPVAWHIEGQPVPLTAGIDLTVYRIIQEALTNTLKHGGPATATVTVRYGADIIELEIVDDGHGAQHANGAGHGLIGMRERVALYGGHIETGQRDGRGYFVHARLPLRSA